MRATVVIRNPQGLHMRPAMIFARLATKFRATVTVRKDDRTVNGKSLLQLMTLAALPGATLDLEVVGEDAEVAMPLLSSALEAPNSEAMEPLLKN